MTSCEEPWDASLSLEAEPGLPNRSMMFFCFSSLQQRDDQSAQPSAGPSPQAPDHLGHTDAPALRACLCAGCRQDGVWARSFECRPLGTPLTFPLSSGRPSQVLLMMESSLGVPYPLGKLDMVAVPGQSESMENWGMITFTEDDLIVGASASARVRTLATPEPVVSGLTRAFKYHRSRPTWRLW